MIKMRLPVEVVEVVAININRWQIRSLETSTFKAFFSILYFDGYQDQTAYSFLFNMSCLIGLFVEFMYR